jgi:hypothetical protein
MYTSFDMKELGDLPKQMSRAECPILGFDCASFGQTQKPRIKAQHGCSQRPSFHCRLLIEDWRSENPQSSIGNPT